MNIIKNLGNIYKTRLIKGDICNIPSHRFPDCDGVIGGTSCQ